MSAKPSQFVIVLILGALATLSPFAIDFYLPAFPQIAAQFGICRGAVWSRLYLTALCQQQKNPPAAQMGI